MSFWDVTNPDRPTGVKDPSAVLDFPVDFSAWLDGATYLSHTVTTTHNLVCESSFESAGVITVVLSGGNRGQTASFTVRITSSSGTDDRTLYLRVQDR